jgi:hypothetical protein
MKIKGVFLAAILTAVLCISGNVLAYSGGDGTAEDPYQIADVNDLLELAAATADYSKYFILTADIDMVGQVFTTAIIAADTIQDYVFQGTAFTGTFDGNGHKITNFTINGNDYLGLFGKIDAGGAVKNLGLEDFAVSGSSGSYYVGGLVGKTHFTNISHCYSTGAVSGYSCVGGLVGESFYGSISNCYATGSVRGTDYYAGGLVAYISFSGSIINCYSTGAVSGISLVGGLVGANAGSISRSFWDTETSGQTTSAGGTGKTTAQMKTLSTFTNAGWDFLGETINGTNDAWRMCADGVNYPKLNWKSINGDFACPDGVNMEDLDTFILRWLMGNCTSANNFCGGADINKTGTVNLVDFAILAENWLEGI